MKLAVIAAMYNEADVVDEFYKRISHSLTKIRNSEIRVIFIDDGSNDSTLTKIKSLKSNQNFTIKVISHTKNCGLEKSIITGLRETRDEIVVVLDADLQDPPELIPSLYDLVKDGRYDLVVCRRILRSTDSFLKRSTAWLFYRMFMLITLNRKIDLDSGNFRALSPNLVQVLLNQNSEEKSFRYSSSVLAKRKIVMNYERQIRFAGTSKYRFKDLVEQAIQTLFAVNHNLIALAIIQFLSSSLFPVWLFFIQDKIKLTSNWIFFSSILALLNLVTSLLIISFFVRIRVLKKKIPLFENSRK